MLNSKTEQRTDWKFLVKLNKMSCESFEALTEVYGEKCMSRSWVFEWHKKICEG